MPPIREFASGAASQFELIPDDCADQAIPDCPHGRANRIPPARPRVISASKRTDIPAFYLPWLIEHCEAGWVDVPNPIFRAATDPVKRLTHVSLRPEHVVAIVWWSKNYAVYERFHDRFACYRQQFFHFTINSRRPDLAWLEPDVPPLVEVLRQLRFLVSLPGGPAMVAWRYDPICFWLERGQPRSSWDPAFFELMCREVARLGVRRCFTSFADRYARFERRVKRFFPDVTLRDPDPAEVETIARAMAEIATGYGVRLLTCAEATLAAQPGFTQGACIDGTLFGATTTPATDRTMPGRSDCRCTRHTDIGDYAGQECGYSCLYCYALHDPDKGARNAAARSRTLT